MTRQWNYRSAARWKSYYEAVRRRQAIWT